jgi:alanyl-tRNA synthetase
MKTEERSKTEMTTDEIRSRFLDYFASKKHRVFPSAPLVPQGDPTLLFVNAGMVPFKDVFTGAAPALSPRAASSQRCLRVSGKHNDLEEVGRTPRHHTLFEMLGNFSFGDYFKEGAIEFAWEFLTGHLKLDPSRLMFTVFGGEKGLAADEEAEKIWRKVTGCGPDRIQRFGIKDNFWSMGDVGPCGPCSEIHYDLGSDLPGKVNDGDRWMEIWNLVFMEFERDASGTLRKLPAPSIDTGMGLERIASVVQGKRSNYETDIFAELLRRISQITGRPYDGGPGDDAVSMRVIADHSRATAFLLADGVMPDRAGRGYVLRKVMRRAISHGVLLGVQHGFLADVAECVVELMGEAHPLLREKEPMIRRGAESEETLYRRTVEEGMRRIDDLLEQLEDETIWMKGTYGTPLELTASVGVRRGFSVDETGFQAAMEVQKERSREHWKGAGAGRDAAEAHFSPKRQEIGATRFTGYEDLEGESQIRSLAIVHEDSLVPAEHAPEGSVVAIVSATTPFYGESGGQVGDTGEIVTPGARVRIEDTRRIAGGELFVHFGTVEEGEIGREARVHQKVDRERRLTITGHHSATHLVHHALREILGTHVAQKGSYVGPDRLRFDFSHTQAVRPDEIDAIEARVNELVRANHTVTTEILPLAQARAKGALAFFGDKYGEIVRVVSMGPSVELCGGTHLASTGEVGFFTFGSEGSVASGVRRIEAFAGSFAQGHARQARQRLIEIAAALRTSPEEALQKVRDLQDESARLKKKIEELEKRSAQGAAGSLADSAQNVHGHRAIVGKAPVETRDALRDLGDSLRATGPSTVVVLGAELEGKLAFVAAVSDDVVKKGKIQAGDLVGKVAKIAGGGGGGKPHLATAGAKDVGKLDEALNAVPGILAEILG